MGATSRSSPWVDPFEKRYTWVDYRGGKHSGRHVVGLQLMLGGWDGAGRNGMRQKILAGNTFSLTSNDHIRVL